MYHTYNIEELILKVENVNLSYDTKPILSNVNFEIFNITRPELSQGQVVALIGRSGIGKTQLFKVLSGLRKPTTGTVKIGVDQHEVHAGEVGIVHQNYILFNHHTIYDNLRLGLENSEVKQTKAEQADIIGDYAEKFDLTAHLKKYPSQLSGGQKQRVSIIQQVLTGNKFILLDEPFSGLDLLMIDKVIELLVKISTSHELNTMIVISHDIPNALAISDTAFILANVDDKGATIKEKINLMDLGFAWEPDIKKNPDFIDLVAQIKYKI